MPPVDQSTLPFYRYNSLHENKIYVSKLSTNATWHRSNTKGFNILGGTIKMDIRNINGPEAEWTATLASVESKAIALKASLAIAILF